MTSPHKIDFHQRAVPRPIERIGKRSPRRTITRRAAALAQISVSFRIAEATVISGTKNTNAWRISTIANSARNRPSQVARETLPAIDSLSVMRKDDASMLSLSMAFYCDVARDSLDSRNQKILFFRV